MVAVGIHGYEWTVIRPPHFHDIDAAIGRRDAAFQPVFMRYKLL